MASKEGVLIDFRTNSFDNLNSNPIEAIEDILDTYGDDVYYDYSDPNYNLYAAHLKAAVITQNAIYMAGIWFNQYLICINKFYALLYN
ncbi:hypothetical protein MKZ25_09380 [Solibacillus sp. FSL W7-1464]|uniref:hypothetical protein n=1 Tax=Solibacillus sp. FSL W7-1464 TaxID=2921706 RepID=UPI0030F7F845